jgi:RNA polymerase sigma factor (sigma-70 family)
MPGIHKMKQPYEVITMCALEAEFPLPVPAVAANVRSLRGAVQRAYRLLAATHADLPRAADAELWIERAVTVLAHNVDSGRFACACRYEQDTSPSLSVYAQQVLIRLMAEWERIEALRAGDSTRWAVALQSMERLAYFWFGPAGREEWALWEAREAAAKTCADLWHWLQRNPFPFDVSFDDWSKRALRNRLNESVRFRRRQARYVVDSLDRPCFEDDRTPGGLLPADDMRVWLELESSREVLRQACARLEQRQAHILHLWYVEGWTAEEIAAETELQVGHVYVLKHRALKKLREYCADA